MPAQQRRRNSRVRVSPVLIHKLLSRLADSPCRGGSFAPTITLLSITSASLMSRSERLLQLLEALRRHRLPVSGQSLARETGVSIRTLYRDIASLQAQGAAIEGEAGVGYVMKPGFTLPPLMFGAEELDALVLGMRMVAEHGDPVLAKGAAHALAKVSAVLPPELRRELETSALLIGPRGKTPVHAVEAGQLRAAIRHERIAYRDPGGTLSERVVWPYALVYFDLVRVVMCWCELREGFRNFRTDRIEAADDLTERYPRRRQALLKEWRLQEHVPERSLLP
jgi:predicted DNA-binding transcriptional regulator YafY